LICPAFPAQDRVTRNGVQWVRYASGGGVAEERPVLSMMETFFKGGDAAAFSLPDFQRLAREEERASLPGALVPDAETDADLDRIVEAGRWIAPLFWVGSAGLASALGRAHPSRDPVPALPPVQRVVIVSGTAHPQAHAQLDSLDGHLQTQYVDPPVTVFQAPRSEAVTLNLEVAEDVAHQARSHSGAPSTGWIVTGGATARSFLEGCGVVSLEVGGEIAPGIPWMLPNEGDLQGSPIITKSGGFGDDSTLIRCVERLLGHRLSLAPPLRGPERVDG
jgi:4-hydroxythreonine-4-phosphate dehydrogenase